MYYLNKKKLKRLIEHMMSNKFCIIHLSNFESIGDVMYFQELCEEVSKKVIIDSIEKGYENFSKAIVAGYKPTSNPELRKLFEKGRKVAGVYVGIKENKLMFYTPYFLKEEGINDLTHAIEDLEAWCDSN